MLTSRKTVGSIPDQALDFLIDVILGWTQPLTEMTGSKGQLARKADNFTAICEPIV
jgi:hypothetical protein